MLSVKYGAEMPIEALYLVTASYRQIVFDNHCHLAYHRL